MTTEVCVTEEPTFQPSPSISSQDMAAPKSRNSCCESLRISLITMDAPLSTALSPMDTQNIKDEPCSDINQAAIEHKEHIQNNPLSQFGIEPTPTKDVRPVPATNCGITTSLHSETTHEARPPTSDSSCPLQVTVRTKEEVQGPVGSVDRGSPIDCPIANIQDAAQVHQQASTETTATTVPAVFSVPITSSQSGAPPSESLSTPPDLGPSSKQNSAVIVESNVPGEIQHDISSAKANETRAVDTKSSTTAQPPARRDGTAKGNTAITAHRTKQVARLAKRPAERSSTTKTLRALQAHRAQQKEANIPTAERSRKKDAHKGETRTWTDQEGLASCSRPLRNVCHGQRHIEPGSERDLYPLFDMDGILPGVYHAIGGLVEATLGIKQLFATEHEDLSRDIYNKVWVERHLYYPYPGLDMKPSNDEFDAELEALRSIFPGLGNDFVEQCIVDGFTEATEEWCARLEEHRFALAIKHHQLTVNQIHLQARVHERKVLEVKPIPRSERAGLEERKKRLSELAKEILPLQIQVKQVEKELNGLVDESINKMRKAFRTAYGHQEQFIKKCEKKPEIEAVKGKITEMGYAAITMGTRPRGDRCDGRSEAIISQYIGHLMDTDETLRDLNMELTLDDDDDEPEPEKQHDPLDELPFTLHFDNVFSRGLDEVQPHAEVVLENVPDWFHVLDGKPSLKLRGETPLDRFRHLLRRLQKFREAGKEEELIEASRPKWKLKLEYHDPHPGWATELRRQKGGWWVCRSGPDAPHQEQYCKLCHKDGTSKDAVLPQTYTEKYQEILYEVRAAMAEQSKKDALMFRLELEEHQRDLDRYCQWRDFVRCGVDVGEVLERKDVNELNYGPAAGWGGQANNQGPPTPLDVSKAIDANDPCWKATNSFQSVRSAQPPGTSVPATPPQTPSRGSVPRRIPQQQAVPATTSIVLAKGQPGKKSPTQAVSVLRSAYNRSAGSSSPREISLAQMLEAGKTRIGHGLSRVMSQVWSPQRTSSPKMRNACSQGAESGPTSVSLSGATVVNETITDPFLDTGNYGKAKSVTQVGQTTKKSSLVKLGSRNGVSLDGI
jgi:hypothetical protein